MFNIALNTFREIIRNKFLYLIIFFSFVFIAFSIFLGKLSLGDDQKLVVDFGLSMIEIFGFLGVLFIGSQLLFKEIEGKTIFLILSKPIKRYEFVLGKFFGFSYVLFLIVFFEALVFLAVLFFKKIAITKIILVSLFFAFLKLEILLAIILFFSTFTSNIIAILVSIGVYLAGGSFGMILDLARHTKNEIMMYFAQGLNLLFPPIEHINTKDLIGTLEFKKELLEVFNRYLLYNGVYSILYIMVLLFLTIVIFNRKTFEN